MVSNNIYFYSRPYKIETMGVYLVTGSNYHYSGKNACIEMQRYTIWIYRYIVTCVLRYSDILHDTTKCKFTDF